MDSVREVFASGKNKICQFTVPVGHSRLHFLLDFQPVRDDEGKITSVLIINTDITGVKPSGEEEKICVESEFRRVFTVNTGLFRAISGRLVEANRALVNMLGYDSAEELAAAVPVFPDGIMSGKPGMPSEPGGETFMRAELRTKNGEHLSVLLRIKHVRDPEGRVFADGLVEDLRGRKIIWHNV
jgi:PAS domain-containing protein